MAERNWWDDLRPSDPLYVYRGIEPVGTFVIAAPYRPDRCPKCGAGHLRFGQRNAWQCRDCDTSG